MRQPDLEHVLAAAAQIVDSEVFVVIGSQAIFGTTDDPPATLLTSMEVDLYVPGDAEKSNRIDGALGDGSPFHQAFGYYAHAVGPETAKAPAGWEDRLVALSVPPRPGSSKRATALCLEVHDLVLAKCVAGRDRDWEYAAHAAAHGLVDGSVLLQRVAGLPVDTAHRDHIRGMLTAILRRVQAGEVPT